MRVGEKAVRRLAAALLVMGLAVVASGCVDVVERFDVNEDGSGTVSVSLAMDRVMLEQAAAAAARDDTGGETMGQPDLAEAFDVEIAKERMQDGYVRVEPVDADGSIGYRLLTDFDGPEDVGVALERLLIKIDESSGGETAGSPRDSLPMATLSVDKGMLGTSYRLSLVSSEESTSGDPAEGSGMEGVISAKLEASLPGEVVETNGTVLGEGSVVEWNLNGDGGAAAEYYVETRRSTFPWVPLGIAAGVLIVLGGGTAAALWFRRRKGRVPASESGDGPPESGSVPSSALAGTGGTPVPAEAPRRRAASVYAPGNPLDGTEILTDGTGFFLADGRALSREQVGELHARGLLRR